MRVCCAYKIKHRKILLIELLANSNIMYKSSSVAEMGDGLATIHMAEKWGLLCPFPWAELHGSPSNTMSPGPRPTSIPNGILIHPAIWSQYTGRKVGGLLCPTFFGGGSGSPPNTMSPGPRPTSVPSGISIHPAMWPQRTWTERTGQTTVRQHRANHFTNGRPKIIKFRTDLRVCRNKIMQMLTRKVHTSNAVTVIAYSRPKMFWSDFTSNDSASFEPSHVKIGRASDLYCKDVSKNVSTQ